ncbi:hypothetical protein Goshw_017630 [Gossypium schwendimanii]|uniref:Aminotransferase-like plant mobile domain-containing protein n=1 Tax=Gossypium schwendimanii TaxID=34291 RepID=A0A7J9N3G8_GOSSC|nr:hypothetical protein [Gossypium schwendimanii]
MFGHTFLRCIRGYLMPNLSRNLVHLRWLLKLVDFRVANEFSWGSVMLATLYWEMCRVTRPSKFYIRFYNYYIDLKYNCMLKIYLIKWNHSASYVRIPTALKDIRLLLDQRSKAQVSIK